MRRHAGAKAAGRSSTAAVWFRIPGITRVPTMLRWAKTPEFSPYAPPFPAQQDPRPGQGTQSAPQPGGPALLRPCCFRSGPAHHHPPFRRQNQHLRHERTAHGAALQMGRPAISGGETSGPFAVPGSLWLQFPHGSASASGH